MDQPQAAAFVAAYRAAFEALDPAAIADHFLYPCALIGDDAAGGASVIASRDAWIPQLERLVAAYRAVGVQSAEPMRIESLPLGPRLAVVSVRWRLGDRRSTVYEFDAAYTLADRGHGPRVAAIAHNELPLLRAALRQRTEVSEA